MTPPVTPERRERPSRAAAPTNMTISDDDDEPIGRRRAGATASGQAKAKRVKAETKHEDSNSDSYLFIPAIKNADVAVEAPNKPTSPNKRISSESNDELPVKKSRRLFLKVNKSAGVRASAVANTKDKAALAQTLTLSPSHDEVLTQLGTAGASRLQVFREGLDSLEAQFLSTLQSPQEREKLKQANKTIELLALELKSKQSDDAPSQSLADELHALRRKNKRLEEKNDDLEFINKDLRMALHNENEARKSRPNSSFKLMDDEVDTEWRGIAFDIRQFVLQILTHEPFRLSAPKGADHQGIEALKRIRKKTPELAPYKFQQYIWQRLVTDVFHAEVNTWGGLAGQAFNIFCLDISKIDTEDMEELSRIKAHTADFLRKSSTHDNCNKAQDIARVMKDHLLIFMDQNRVEESGSLLWNIVRRAVKLNGLFLRSKAFYLTNWIVEDFDLEDLDICYTRGKPKGQPKLDIEISPRLSKIGNADGKRFDTAMVMCKPAVTISKE
ncbi:hypothetical protein ACHAP5_001926 [Fusarium lateritium]